MRPGKPGTQSKRGIPIQKDLFIEPAADLGPGSRCVACLIRKSKSAAAHVGLAVGRRVEVLLLNRRVRDKRSERGWEAVTALEACAKSFCRKARREMVAHKGKTVCRRPVLRIGECRTKIKGSAAGNAVDTGLERIGPARAKPLREAPSGAGTRERKANRSAGRDPVIHAGRNSGGTRRTIVAADKNRISICLVDAAICCAPHAPGLVDWPGLVHRHAQHFRVGKRDVLRERLTLGRERSSVAAANAGTAIDKGIKHQCQELAAELERSLLSACGDLSGEQRERICKIGTGQVVELQESRGQRSAVVEEIVDRRGNRCLVLREPCVKPERGSQV
jgi:hypothetical protein